MGQKEATLADASLRQLADPGSPLMCLETVRHVHPELELICVLDAGHVGPHAHRREEGPQS